MIAPRNNRITWDDHHMLMALTTAMRSPDPNTQVGACIVDSDNRIVATGYNSFPRGIDPHTFSWDRKADNPLDTKYPYVVHAERNAVHNKIGSVKGATCYVTLFPCNICMQALIQEGIIRVVWLEDKYPDAPETIAAKRMAEATGIELVKHQWTHNPSELFTHFQS